MRDPNARTLVNKALLAEMRARRAATGAGHAPPRTEPASSPEPASAPPPPRASHA